MKLDFDIKTKGEALDFELEGVSVGGGGLSENEVRDIVKEETANLQPLTDIGASVEETELTLELKNKNGEVLSSTTVTLPSSGGEIPNLDEYVKFTNYASSSSAGVVKVFNETSGLTVGDGGWLSVAYANATDLQWRHNRSLSSVNLDEIMQVGMTTNTKTLTDEEKTSACDWLGVAKVALNIGSIPSYATTAYIRKPDGTIVMMILDAGQGLATRKVGNYEYVFLSGATNAQIDTRQNKLIDYKALTYDRLDYAIMSALANCKDTTIWTEEKKAAARALLGVDDLIAELRAEIASLKGQ